MLKYSGVFLFLLLFVETLKMGCSNLLIIDKDDKKKIVNVKSMVDTIKTSTIKVHTACIVVLSSISRCLDTPITHDARVFDILYPPLVLRHLPYIVLSYCVNIIVQ